MNDIVSQRPPSLYIREEKSMEQYTIADMEDVDMVCDAGIESNRPSGMFRFGKAIASAFTSANVWQGLNGIWKEREKENQAKPEKDVLKAKAELKYAELKKSGYKGTYNPPVRPESLDIPRIKFEETYGSRWNSFRDSGVDVDDYQSSSDQKNSDQFMRATKENLMPPPPMPKGVRSSSPFSDASSGNRSSIRFHKPSLEGLKRVSSQLHLPSIKRHAENPLSVLSSSNSNVTVPELRREPSKKDMAKQHRLSKKVSDLENKLEFARRELELSRQEAPPVPDLPAHVGRKRFVPGSLPSLPSERLLTPRGRQNEDTVKENHAKADVAADTHNADTSTDERGNKKMKYKVKTQDDSAEAAKQALWDKRASDIAAHNAAARQSKGSKIDTKVNDAFKSEAANGSALMMKCASPSVPRESKVSGRHDSSEVHKRSRKGFAKTPCNSPMTSKDQVPPMPVKRAVFDPMNIDKAKIIAMRAITDSRAPFGKAWDDFKNLQKVYPDTAESELKAYIRSSQSTLSNSNKITDHTSVKHGDGPCSPFLGRPCSSTSPMKTRAQTHASRRAGISPPPPSLSSSPVKKFQSKKSPVMTANRNMPRTGNGDDDEDEEREEGKDFFDAKMSFGKAGFSEIMRTEGDVGLERSVIDTGKDVKIDEFEWDDDVF